MEDPVAFTPADAVEPRCELKPDAPPEAAAARDTLLAAWTTLRNDRASKAQALDGLGKALGLAGGDDSLIVAAMENEAVQLAQRGCITRCNGLCTTMNIQCKDDADAQRRANTFMTTINAYLPQLTHTPTIPTSSYGPPTGADLARCDSLPVSMLTAGNLFTMALATHVLKASHEIEMQRCAKQGTDHGAPPCGQVTP